MVKLVGGAGASARTVRVRRAVALGLLLLLACLPGAAAVAADRAEGDGGGRAAYLAERLRENPVYVTDQAPREIPRSAAAEFAKAAKRTGVPTYVVLLPRRGPFDERLLGAVHDRLRRDGLYVLLDSSGIGVTAVPFGVDVPASSATAVALYELPYDAGPLLTFQRFVEALTDDDPEGRAEAARQKYGSDADSGPAEEPDRLHSTRTDRENQSFLTGILLAGVPLLALMLVPYVLRRRTRRRGAAAGGKQAAPGGFAGVGRRGLTAAVAAAAVLAGGIAVGAALMFDDKTSDPGPPPTRADMDARLHRVAAGLARDPVYVDPESPAEIDAAELKGLRTKIGGLDVPVYVASVPMAPEDESGGQGDTFLRSLGRTVGEDGVYVLADPGSGYVNAVDHGIGLDVDLYLLPEEIGYPPRDAEDDLRLGERVGMLVEELTGARRGGGAGQAPSPVDPPDPVSEDALPSVFAGDFVPGLVVGALAAALAFGVVAGAVGVLGRRRSPVAAGAAAGPLYAAPPDPSETYLRRTAHAELEALAREFEAADPGGAVRTRVWDCLDAARLLVDVAEDGRIDADAPPEALAAAIVLARAGRAALARPGTPAHLCTLNPMHGPAHGKQRTRLAPGAPARAVPLCTGCRTAASSAPATAHTLRLTLPSPRGKARIPYDTAPGPLRAAGAGVPRLIREVQESAGVHD
ncbi:hypothetical protein [Streptomyces sp. 184]|uniref:hypothetical protein n=1 Tax=Streptomyces sp. 184 TaxID=1827526 RepID=UPI0038926D13